MSKGAISLRSCLSAVQSYRLLTQQVSSSGCAACPPPGITGHCQSGAGRNALHVACANGALDLARWLISLGLDVEATSADGLRAVHVAALGGHIDVLRWLVDAGGAGALPGTTTTIGVTALHCACMKGHT